MGKRTTETTLTGYEAFLESKAHRGSLHGFDPEFVPDFLFDFQKALVEWSVRKGRSAVFADCGLGKTPMQLVWAENVVRKTNKPVLILTPLAVAHQTVREGQKFGIGIARSHKGEVPDGCKIVAANYQRLHHFDPKDFDGVACDESSILKSFDGVTRKAITTFMLKVPYRSLWTATAAPNDFIELGNSSEAIGEMPHIDMLQMFFKSIDGSYAQGGSSKGGAARWNRDRFQGGKFRFRGHAERDFWRWVCSWARALRKPSDMGCEDDGFKLPPLDTRQHVVKARTRADGFLFDLPAMGLREQRAERRRTIEERCEMAASLVNGHDDPAVCWCHLNSESKMLKRMIPDAVEVSGDDDDESKEEAFDGFQRGSVRVIVTKPTIGGFGLNWQHCAHQTFFPSHSFEQYYQAIRRSWRFGQKRPVRVDIVTSEGEASVMSNLQRKSDAADRMFDMLIEYMDNELKMKRSDQMNKKVEVPTWL